MQSMMAKPAATHQTESAETTAQPASAHRPRDQAQAPWCCMPARLKRACRYSGCSGTTTHRSGYCEKHQPTESSWAPWQRKKGSSSQRGYGSEWRKLRAMILERDNHLCQEHLKQGVIKAGHHVDHIVSKAQEGTDEPSNLQTLCHSCHAHKTATERQKRHGG